MSEVSKPAIHSAAPLSAKSSSVRKPAKKPLGLPWNERNAKFSPFKTAVLVGVALPGLAVIFAMLTDDLGARPVNEVIHRLGLWVIRLLLISLAITPLRQIFNWPRLVVVRRMVGVAAFVYLALHFGAYIVDEAFDLSKVVSEIVNRLYLTIGFVALAILAALAATSTDGMVRRLGGRHWQNLHRLVYLAALLGSIHYFLQSKLNVYEPTVMAGLFIWMMGYRAIGWLSSFRRAAGLPSLLALAIGATLITGLGEALYYQLARNIDFMRVLSLDWSLIGGVRPALVVLIGTLVVALSKPAVDYVQHKLRRR
ncbi:MAG: protein-methionine-sulfoxide reductase heme-binding subunit MsrQ [Rhodospirillales bacterium]